MSRRKLAQCTFSSASDKSNGDGCFTLESLQKFAAPKKRCLSLDIKSEEVSNNITEVARHMNETGIDSSEENLLWARFYKLECNLNEALRKIDVPANITHTYNPLEYAAQLHCGYLKKFLDGPKRVVFVGMNPGPNGMGQTGVPFGNILTVRNEMCLTGAVKQPPSVHAKRPVLGLECTTEEPSGVRIWGLLKKLAGGSLTTFGRQCFVHNFCPLIFHDKAGRNITPSELKGDYKSIIGKLCLEILDQELDLLQPEIVIAVGEYMNGMLKNSRHANSLKIFKLPHPSPRSLNNQNWPEKAEQLLCELDLVKYIRGEV
ncbi:single-strand selective monofunctional uracil DNA glycosylase [Eurosta solidaginis]|uniref:single-strand selective monofunctional uracil DNA glycosylase n=1 Tax=Eurosta solidaginis TaxID=178769 RepID=UPI003531097F